MRKESCLGALVAAGTLTAMAAIDSLEKSALFETREDAGSGVQYKVLRHGVGGGWNHQQLYFVQKSLTEDGRFLLVCASDNEFGAEKMRSDWVQRVQIIDLENDKVIDFGGAVRGFCTCLDRKNDRVWQVNREGFFYYDLKASDPTAQVKVCALPANLLAEEKDGGRMAVIVGHLTLNADATGAFIDSTLEKKSVQGYIDFTTGAYTKWGETGFYLFHGQTNPKNPKLALACFEDCWHLANYEVEWLTPEEKAKLVIYERKPWRAMHSIYKRPSNWAYPRLQLVEPGRRTTVIPLYGVGATHERWDEQGEGFYWCGGGGVWYHDLATGDEYKLSPCGSHAFVTADKRYIVSDNPYPRWGWYRGCRWRTYFYDRQKQKGVFFNSDMARYAPSKERESCIHPDPHPQFVCGDRYALWTHNLAGRMELAFAKTEDLSAACGRNSLLSLPEWAQPTQVARQLAGCGQAPLPQLALGPEAEETLCRLLHPYHLTGGAEKTLQSLAEALHRGQREDGLWGKTIEAAKDAQSAPDYAKSALFAYVAIEGVRQGFLDVELYAPMARRAWVKLCADLTKPGVAAAAPDALQACTASLAAMARQLPGNSPGRQP